MTTEITLVPAPEPPGPYLDGVTIIRLCAILVLIYVLVGTTLGTLAWFKVRRKG